MSENIQPMFQKETQIDLKLLSKNLNDLNILVQKIIEEMNVKNNILSKGYGNCQKQYINKKKI